ncbi:helix-turn-helix transcriptional regulator [Paracoccus sp. (in: a-proteobacteria)]|uniref:helix-turn-helix domain-containing protein n=1 Tax=Paracoccus sp. TaxID=267 RepID=UPI0026E06DBD|nr:helix-turn-helix transcriptional regulator [Paracoccus sp. (in: a-proteobacteria)]MDO5370571.1 helix-turn-helix transcriptional regulator [Paracoccus sp. (in: a-proteobacteria)]
MTPAQCRAARALLGLEQGDVAERAGIARATLIDFEKDQRTPRAATIAAIQTALEDAGVEFIADEGEGVGVRLRKEYPIGEDDFDYA